MLVQALSADGRCKTFDTSGDGYGRGEGFAVAYLGPGASTSRTLALLQVCSYHDAMALHCIEVDISWQHAQDMQTIGCHQPKHQFHICISVPKRYHISRKLLSGLDMLLFAGVDSESGRQVILPDRAQWSVPEAAHCGDPARC